MSTIKNNPVWVSAFLFLIGLCLFLSTPDKGSIYWVIVLIPAALLIFQLAFMLLKRINPPPVPDSAIRDMIGKCTKKDQNDEWVLVKFRPKISLEEARSKVGSETYSEEDRLQGFMSKYYMVASVEPSIAIFYAPNKGFLLANRAMLKHVVSKYGRWMLDTWYSLNGALGKEGLSTRDLDSPQTIAFG